MPYHVMENKLGILLQFTLLGVRVAVDFEQGGDDREWLANGITLVASPSRLTWLRHNSIAVPTDNGRISVEYQDLAPAWR